MVFKELSDDSLQLLRYSTSESLSRSLGAGDTSAFLYFGADFLIEARGEAILAATNDSTAPNTVHAKVRYLISTTTLMELQRSLS